METLCQCCGKSVESRDGFALHTKCMRTHAAHLDGVKASRCKAMAGITRQPEYKRLPEDFDGDFMALVNPDTYMSEGLKAAQIIGTATNGGRCGAFGAICRHCLREVPMADNGAWSREARESRSYICHCVDVEPVHSSVMLAAIGLSSLKTQSKGRDGIAV